MELAASGANGAGSATPVITASVLLRIALACRMPAVPTPIRPTFSGVVIVIAIVSGSPRATDPDAGGPVQAPRLCRGNDTPLSGRRQDPAAAALRCDSVPSPDNTEYETDSRVVAALATADHPPGPRSWFGASGPAVVRPATNPAYTGGAAPSTAFEPARLRP